MKLLIILLILINYSNALTEITNTIVCGNDNTLCGNVPYRLCKSNSSLIDGFGNKIDIDKINSRVLFTIKYNDEFESRVVSLDIESSIENKGIGGKLKSHGTLYGQSTYQLIRGLFQYLPISERMIINRQVRIAGSTSNIFFPNNTFGNELTWTEPGNFIFDELNDIQYTCWPYTSKIYKGKIGLYNDLGETFYLGPCFEMKNVENKLYIFDGSSTIYLGNLNQTTTTTTTPPNIIDLPIVYNDKVNNRIKEFDIDDSNSNLYISDLIDKKIYQISLTNGTKKTILSIEDNGELPTSFQYFNNFIYYPLNGKILRVATNSIENSTPQVLFDSKLSSNCICAQGFTGLHCNECDLSNNIISWNNGIPRCIPIVNGNPITCDFDYQCKSNKCQIIPISDGNKGC